jgi:hypothetical protein
MEQHPSSQQRNDQSGRQKPSQLEHPVHPIKDRQSPIEQTRPPQNSGGENQRQQNGQPNREQQPLPPQNKSEDKQPH